ncbi:peptidylprolyl isomerase [Candidatus Woesearchaeota archaeon]|nr:peptidylprolyl isomerase [Candidatus Woesearchaeota archaeon]
MPVNKGDKIKVEYTGTFDDGEIFDTSSHGDHSHPLEFEAGSGQVIKGFDEAVIGMEKGEEKEIRLEPSEGYGDYNDELVKDLPRDQFSKDFELKVGMMIGVNIPNGPQVPAKVVKLTKNEVTLDMNHPLAGKALNFKIKIIDISYE